MKKMFMIHALIVGGLSLSGVVSAAAPSVQMLANTCAGCHGTFGVSQGPGTPTIAGVSKDYFIDAMKEYKAGTRPSTVMSRIAKGYSDEEIAAMAGYFAEQKYIAHRQDFDGNLARKGKVLHEKYCEKCHEDGGRSAEDDAGLLAGQWAPYLGYTFADYEGGSRQMDKKMAKKVEEMQADHGKGSMDMLLNYYASQGDK